MAETTEQAQKRRKAMLETKVPQFDNPTAYAAADVLALMADEASIARDEASIARDQDRGRVSEVIRRYFFALPEGDPARALLADLKTETLFPTEAG